MKNAITFKIFLLCLMVNTLNAQRYLEEVFDEVEVMTDITYGENITLITLPTTGMPSVEELKMDVYRPIGDTETERPLIISIHSGDFLPLGTNGKTIGTRTDSFEVETATRLAKMGYVVATINYRQGWNPLAPNGEDITSGLVNATYRGIQDVHTCIRFFRKDIEENGNNYNICTDKIAVWGNGTGGTVALGVATVDDYDDLLIAKLIDSDGLPYVNETISSNPFATTDGELNIANHVGYSSEVALSVNMGGFLIDTSWITPNDPPIISFQVPTDPFAPYGEDVFVQHPGTIILEIQGAYTIQSKVNDLGINQVFVDANIQDEFTDGANTSNDGLEGLYPFHRPCPPSLFQPDIDVCEGAPWEWWDINFWSQQEHSACQASSLPLEDCNYHLINANNNQDVSPEKGRMYIDTIVGYFAPRAYAALNLGSENCMVATQDLLNETTVNLQITPNPANAEMRFSSDENEVIERIEIYNLSGQLIDYQEVNSSSFLLKKEGLSKGIFIAKVQFEKGIVAEKIVFN